jgi:peptide/nickel transport system substrate-binding protein
LPGLPDTEADSFLRKNDPRGPIVGQPLARYHYDPTRALQELAEVGWRRGPDGRLVNQSGEPVQMYLRGSSSATEETTLVAQLWRQVLGVNVEEEIVPANLTQDREYRAKFPGMEFRSSNGDAVFGLFESRGRVSAENQYRGSNPMGYSNPAFDPLLDRFFQTLDLDQQAAVIKEMSEVLANDVPVIPMYVRVDLAAVRQGVRALDDYAGTTLTRGMARTAHLWDRD